MNACRMSARHFPARQGPFAGALAALCLVRDDFLKGEPHTVPAAQILRQAGEVLAVLFAHPTERGFTIGEPVGGACRVWFYVLLQYLRRYVPRPPGSAPTSSGERLAKASLASLAGLT